MEPPTFWDTIAPDLYGFYSNVNPGQQNSIRLQDTERRIGENSRIPTLLHNGYDSKVGSLLYGDGSQRLLLKIMYFIGILSNHLILGWFCNELLKLKFGWN